jgi:hypothetical protein
MNKHKAGKEEKKGRGREGGLSVLCRKFTPIWSSQLYVVVVIDRKNTTSQTTTFYLRTTLEFLCTLIIPK